MKITKIIFLLLGILVSAVAEGVEFYVSPEGNDANPGTQQAPFATLKRAQHAVRVFKSQRPLDSPIFVNLSGGIYTLSETLTLTSADSGRPTSPIVWRAVPGQKVYLVGGKPVDHFELYQGKILKADLAKQGFNKERIGVVIFNGQRQQMARYPNHDPSDLNGGKWAFVDGQRVDMYSQMPEDEDDYYKTHQHLDFWQRNLPRLTRTLKMKPEDLRIWRRPSDGQVSIFPRFNWWHYVLQIESFDPKNRTLHLGPGNFYEIRPGDRYFVRGLLEELDSPGEWYYDPLEKILYFWPPEELTHGSVFIAILDNIITMSQCEYVEFHNFVIECSNGTAVQLKDCRSCAIRGCIIRNVGDAPNLAISHYEGSAISIKGGCDNQIMGNDIEYIGGYGVYVDSGDKETLQLGNTIIENNVIHHVGLVDRKAKGIEITGAGNHIRHNLIHHIPQSGIYIWGSKHIVEYNHIHHTCLEAEDTGAIGGGNIDWLGWHGVAIRYNYIHDTIGFGYDQESGQWKSPYFVWALYADWAPAGTEIIGNILVRAPSGLIHLHCGRHNRIENNILVDGGQSQIYWSGWNIKTGYWTTMVDTWTENYHKAVRSIAWCEVPTMVKPATVPLPDGFLMYDNIFVRNIIFYHEQGAMLYHLRQLPLDRNTFDKNLIYHQELPLLTGIVELEKVIGDNLIEDGGFERGFVGQPPKGWPHFDTASGKVSVSVTDKDAHGGRHALRIEPGPQPPEHKAIRFFYFPVATVPYSADKAFVLEGWIKSESLQSQPVEIFSFTWKIMKTIIVSNDWTYFQFVFQIPQKGQMLFDPHKKNFQPLLVFSAGTGPFLLDDISLKEAVVKEQWQTWQEMGKDKHSIIANPLFVDAEKGDYRLQSDSPAWKIGFEPIQINKIGPYQHPLRASWPIK